MDESVATVCTVSRRELGVPVGDAPFEGASVEVKAVGFHFPGGVHLVGDAAGMPSGLTAEGVYPALITGEEIARCVLEPNFPKPKTRAWMRAKRVHDILARLSLRRRPREFSFAVLAAWCRHPRTRRWVSALLSDFGRPRALLC